MRVILIRAPVLWNALPIYLFILMNERLFRLELTIDLLLNTFQVFNVMSTFRENDALLNKFCLYKYTRVREHSVVHTQVIDMT